MTYCLTPARRVSPDAPESVQFLARVFGSLARRIVCNWSVTQRASVLEQLRGGIRYLDIRLAMTAGLQNPVVAHGLYGEEVGPLLALVDTFLASHPGEVLVLDFQHFYDFTAADHSRLISVLQDLFGPRLCPFWPGAPEEISLRWLCAHGYQIILVYRCDNGRRCAGMWPGETLPTPWPNTTNISALLGILQRGLEARDMRRGHVAQCLLTPKPATVMCGFGGMCSSLERQLVRPCNDAVIPWLTKQRPGSKRSSLNIAIADFIARDSPFAATVIQLNAKLLDLPSLVSSPVSIKA
ncbi:hypothetical protein B566_EDAN003544 [Ephemera danica]|nr:hypothetical protein B566_EDAN003544 [Ephemera danica]